MCIPCTLGFGLLHGFGFGRALLEIGLPQSEIPIALLSFNIGVEAGQLLFIAACLLIAAAIRKFGPNTLKAGEVGYRYVNIAMPYLIGGMGAYWFIQRTLQM